MLEQIQVQVMEKDNDDGLYDQIHEYQILRISGFQKHLVLAHQAEETFSNGPAGQTGDEDKEPAQQQKAGADKHPGILEQHTRQEHYERSQDGNGEIATAQTQHPNDVIDRQQYAELTDIS